MDISSGNPEVEAIAVSVENLLGGSRKFADRIEAFRIVANCTGIDARTVRAAYECWNESEPYGC